jgi:hypothetical protein
VSSCKTSRLPEASNLCTMGIKKQHVLSPVLKLSGVLWSRLVYFPFYSPLCITYVLPPLTV